MISFESRPPVTHHPKLGFVQGAIGQLHHLTVQRAKVLMLTTQYGGRVSNSLEVELFLRTSLLCEVRSTSTT